MIDFAALRRLAANGMSADMIIDVVEAMMSSHSEAIARRRKLDAARQQKRRNASRGVTRSHADSTGCHEDVPISHAESRGRETAGTDPATCAQVVSWLDGKEEVREGSKEKKTTKKESVSASFTKFWTSYPHKVGKRDAEKSFDRALARADLGTILAGLDRYVRKKDDRPWCNPATWLNQDRWADQPAPEPIQRMNGNGYHKPEKPNKTSEYLRSAWGKPNGHEPDDLFGGTTIDGEWRRE